MYNNEILEKIDKISKLVDITHYTRIFYYY